MATNDRWSHDILDASATSSYPELETHAGLTLTHSGSNTTGTVAGFSQGDKVVLIDRHGARHVFRAFDGAFLHEGRRVALRTPTTRQARPPTFTASGSIAAPDRRAGVARASRIWVEGIHDAELIEKVWGDDLRYARVAVEPLHGADDLARAVTAFAPGPQRRLGVLLDHLVAGTKESQIAASVAAGDVLVAGHPYVDVWAAVSPQTIGLNAWPEVPRGVPWKDGVLAALGLDLHPGEFWSKVLEAVASYRDLETPLVNAVEQLIDFVTDDAE